MVVILLLQETCIPSKELRCKILNTENNHEYFKDATNEHKHVLPKFLHPQIHGQGMYS